MPAVYSYTAWCSCAPKLRKILSAARCYHGLLAVSLLGTLAGWLLPAAIAAPVPIELVPDRSFAPSFEKTQGQISTMATYPNGDVLVAGQFSSLGDSTPTNIARFKADGTLDSTFASADISGGEIRALLVLADGRILVGGRFSSVGGTSRPGLARLEADGSLDDSFLPEISGQHGIVQLRLQSTGKIIVGDAEAIGGGLYRLFPDGKVDSSFRYTGFWGWNTTLVVQPDDRMLYQSGWELPGRLTADGEPDPSYRISEAIYGHATCLAIQPDGKALVGGSLTEVSSRVSRELVRLAMDGTLDTTFVQQGFVGFDPNLLSAGRDGRIYIAGYDLREPDPAPSRVHRFSSTGVEDVTFDAYAATPRHLKAMAVLSDGGLLVAGDSDLGRIGEHYEIARVLPDGSDGPGTAFAARNGGTVHAVLRFPDGSWLVGGDFSRTNGELTGALVKLDAAGRVVPGFIPDTGIDGIVYALAEAPGGRILVGGNFTQYGATTAPHIARLTATGAADPTFQPGSGPNGAVYTILAQSDGGVTLGGAFTSYDGTNVGRIVRLLSTGARDAAFQASPGFSGDVNTLVALAEGRILVGGAFYQHAGADAGGVLRLLADGTRDPTFALSSGYTYSPTLALGTSADGTRFIGCSTSIFWITANGSHLVLESPDGRARGVFHGLLAQPDGSFIAAGTIDSNSTNVVRHPIARILADGSLDGSFNVAGVLAAGASHTLHDLGRFRYVVGGEWSTFEGFNGKGLVMLQPGPTPAILAQPDSVRTQVGATVTFSVDAVGQDLQYQWFHDGAAIAGATGAQLTLTGIEGAAAGTYHVIVSNTLGWVRSREVTLMGSGTPPSVTSSPQTIGVRSGETARLSVTASGAQPLRYVWRHQGVVVANSDSSELVIESARFTDAGLYEVEVFDGLNSARVPMGRLTVYPEVFSTHLRVSRQWDVSPEVAGGNAGVLSMAPDGSFVVGGSFERVDAHRTSNLARFKSDGSIDTAFRAAAISDGGIQAIAVQGDGRVLVGGGFSRAGGTLQRGIVRLLTDGTVDPSFTTGDGFLLGGSRATICAIGLQSDGRIIVAGDFDTFNGSTAPGIVRLHPNGTLDTTFGGTTGFVGVPTTLLVLPDDRIAVGGSFRYYQGVAADYFVRLTPDGAVDPDYITYTGLDEPVYSIAVQSDGALLLGGAFNHAKGLARHGLVRLTPNGALDTTFDPPFTSSTSITTIRVTGSGRILVGGRIFRLSPLATASLVRLTDNGAEDGGFAAVPADTGVASIGQLPGGRIITAGPRPAEIDVVTSPLALFEADGTAVTAYAPDFLSRSTISYAARSPEGGLFAIGPFTHINGVPCRSMAKITADGSLEAAFNPPVESLEPGAALLVQPDGIIYTTAKVSAPNGMPRQKVVRLLDDGAIDTSFSAPLDTYAALAVQSDGRIVVSSRFSDAPPGQIGTGIMRLNTDGSIDPAFAAGNGATTPYAGVSQIISSIRLQADGRIVVAGNYSTVNGTPRRGVARLTAGGAIDTSFNANSTFDQVLNIGVNSVELLANGHIAVGTGSGLLTLDGTGARTSAYAPENYNWDNVLTLALASPDMIVIGGEAPLAGVWPHLLDAIAMSGAHTEIFDSFSFYSDGNQPRVSSTFFLDDGRLVATGANIPDANGAAVGLVVFEPDPYAGPIDGPPIVAAGQGATLRARADDPTLTYQWYINGSAISGATDATLAIPCAQGLHRGDYHVVVSNAHGSSRSGVFTLAVDNAPDSGSRILNLSTRALCRDGDNILIPGFVISGEGTRRLLLRAVGPQLGGMGIANPLPDPQLLLKRWVNDRFEDFATNDNWGDNANPAELAQVSAQLGAFDLEPGSLDSALLLDLPAGMYTALGYDSNSRPGIAMVEIYDADDQSSSTRLVNLSNRGYVGVGDGVMIPGFVVSEEGPRTFLIRVVGPTLRGLGVSEPLSDPVLNLHRHVSEAQPNQWLLANDDWWRSPDANRTRDVAELVGASPLQEDSADAACVVTLPPGIYTVIGSGTGDSTGVALVEVYLVP